MNTPSIPETASRYRLWSLLALFAQVLMDGALYAMWYQAIVQPEGVPWGEILLIFLGVLLGSQMLTALTARLNWPLLVRQTIFLGWLIGMILVSMKLLLFAHTPVTLMELISWPLRFITLADSGQASFIHLVFVLILMWRGVALARGPYNPRSVIVNFQMGLLALLLYGMFFAPRYPAASSAGLYLYLFSGLIALSATRILSLTDLRAGRMPQFNLTWVASTFGSAMLVVAIALLLGWASSGQLVALALRVVVIILTMLAALLTVLLDPLVRWLWGVFPALMAPLKALFGLFTGMRLPRFLEQVVVDLSGVISQIAPAIINGRRLFLFAILIVIVLAVLLGMRWMSSLRPGEMAEETASVEGNSLKNLLRRLGLGARAASRGRRYSAGQLLAAARIRQIYSQMMALSTRLGAARPAAATPLEFLPQLQQLFAEEQESVQAITQAYVKIRYGEYPEEYREVNDVVAAWERVKKHARTLSRRQQS